MTLRALPLLLVASLPVFIATAASAQTAAVTLSATVTRRDGRLPTGIKPNVINYADCAADDSFGFTMAKAVTPASTPMQVWVSLASVSGCGALPIPNTVTVPDSCWQAFEASPAPTGGFSIKARDILPHGASGSGTGDASVCDAIANLSPGSGTVNLNFIPVTGDNMSSGGTATYAVTYDLAGPTPPIDIQVGVGDTRLLPSWTVGTDKSATSYKVYCEPSDAQCTPTYLIPDTIPIANPPGEVFSSSAGQSSTKGDVTGLINDQIYACAVAGVDTNGNVGKLSAVACGSPKPVDGYYKTYVEAGGQAGGGFCSFGRSATNGALVPLVFGALGTLIARRRRAARSARADSARQSHP